MQVKKGLNIVYWSSISLIGAIIAIAGLGLTKGYSFVMLNTKGIDRSIYPYPYPVEGGIQMTILQGLVPLLIAIIGFFIVRTLRQVDGNQKETCRQLKELAKNFYELKGEHNALSNRHSNGE